MNLDQFVVENEARAYRQRRLARAEQERRLALLDQEPSMLADLSAQLAMRWSEVRRGARSVLPALASGGCVSSPRASVTTGFREEE